MGEKNKIGNGERGKAFRAACRGLFDWKFLGIKQPLSAVPVSGVGAAWDIYIKRVGGPAWG